MPKIVLSHPEDNDVEIRVKYRAVMPEEFAGADEDERAEMWEDDGFAEEVEVDISQIEERLVGDVEWIDESKKWSKSSLLDDVEELVREHEVERNRMKYLDRLAMR